MSDTSSGDEELTDEARGIVGGVRQGCHGDVHVCILLDKKKKFQEWRKAHYNEYQAVQRARQLMKVTPTCATPTLII